MNRGRISRVVYMTYTPEKSVIDKWPIASSDGSSLHWSLRPAMTAAGSRGDVYFIRDTSARRAIYRLKVAGGLPSHSAHVPGGGHDDVERCFGGSYLRMEEAIQV